MNDLLESYKDTLRMVSRAKRKADEDDSNKLAGVIVSLRYCITWMETGFEPEATTDSSRYSYSRREIPMDPAWLARYRVAQTRSYFDAEDDDDYKEAECDFRKDKARGNKAILDDLLASLTPKEREALIMVRGAGNTFQDAADLMGYKSRGSVERLVASAEEKLRETVAKAPNGIDDIYLLKPLQVIMAL